jgi:hypothetical protein
VLLRVLPLLVLSVFINPDSEACEPIGDLKTSVISIRYSRSFSEAVKIANFSSNKGSGWVCASACRISIITCFNREASFLARCVFIFSNIYISLSIYLIKSVRAINLSDYFNEDVCFRFLTISSIIIIIIIIIILQ